MVEIGQISLVIAVLVAGYATVASFLGAGLRVPELAASGRYALYSLPFLLLVPTVALVDAFVGNDFSVRYVAENSNLAMPAQYTWVAMYAGNAGSLLFLALVLAGISAIAVRGLSRGLPHSGAYASGILMLTLTFFLTIILGFANPLERLPITPADGQGINPLLVHFGMFIHPPMQMTGLVMVSVPFSIAMGAMMAGRGGRDEWVGQGRLWGMITWLVLTVGLLLGAWWGVHDSRLGRLLGLGPGRELGTDAVAGHDRFRALDNGPEAPWDVQDVEHGADHHRVRAGADGHVHQPWGPGTVGPLLCAVQYGLAVPVVHGFHFIGIVGRILVALRHSEEPGKS